MFQLTNIWPAPQPLNLSFAVLGGTVTVTIAADCKATADSQSSSVNLTTQIPQQYWPSAYRGSNAPITVIKSDVPANGGALITPTGWMWFYPYGGNFEPDVAPAESGVAAQAFSYNL